MLRLQEIRLQLYKSKAPAAPAFADTNYSKNGLAVNTIKRRAQNAVSKNRKCAQDTRNLLLQSHCRLKSSTDASLRRKRLATTAKFLQNDCLLLQAAMLRWIPERCTVRGLFNAEVRSVKAVCRWVGIIAVS